MSQTVFSDGLGYEGKVTLTLKSNNRILKSKTYKNNGTEQLFRFLSKCLIGACEDAEAQRLLPNKLLLLNNFSSSDDPEQAIPTQVNAVTDWVPFSQLPTSISNTSQGSVTYNFEIPKNAITGPFNQIALYGKGMDLENNVGDFSAYYYLTNNDGAIEKLDPRDWSPTTILLIDWELTISNKNIGTTTV